jgi:hypothetical protein
MVREAARGLNGPATAKFESAVIARLQQKLDGGTIERVTKNQIRAARSAELASDK